MYALQCVLNHNGTCEGINFTFLGILLHYLAKKLFEKF